MEDDIPNYRKTTIKQMLALALSSNAHYNTGSNTYKEIVLRHVKE